MTEPKNLKEILAEAMSLRNMNMEKLADLTDIPAHYLSALFSDEYKKLPAAPYVRGYLLKIAEALNIDSQSLWQIYKKENPLKISGEQDRLPVNRFAIKPFNKRNLVIGIVVVLIIIYVAWRLDKFLGVPEIEIINPAVNNLVVDASSVKLIGRITSGDKLTVNNEEIAVDAKGQFEKDFTLQPGLNSVEFKVKRFLGKETKVLRQVIYQPKDGEQIPY